MEEVLEESKISLRLGAASVGGVQGLILEPAALVVDTLLSRSGCRPGGLVLVSEQGARGGAP